MYVEALTAGIAGRFQAHILVQGELVTNCKEVVSLELTRCDFGTLAGGLTPQREKFFNIQKIRHEAWIHLRQSSISANSPETEPSFSTTGPQRGQ